MSRGWWIWSLPKGAHPLHTADPWPSSIRRSGPQRFCRVSRQSRRCFQSQSRLRGRRHTPRRSRHKRAGNLRHRGPTYVRRKSLSPGIGHRILQVPQSGVPALPSARISQWCRRAAWPGPSILSAQFSTEWNKVRGYPLSRHRGRWRCFCLYKDSVVSWPL